VDININLTGEYISSTIKGEEGKVLTERKINTDVVSGRNRGGSTGEALEGLILKN
jgi:hypothetical protein